METFGKVQLAGTGSGDISLLALKAMVYTKQTNVTIYDRLVNPKTLKWMLPNCLLVGVGKNLGFHCVPQDETNALLVQYTQTHNNIVCPRDGDPYVFGRRAEEVKDPVETDIPFEVAPGTNSTIDGLTYAGTPVTHHDSASRFHMVIGHTREGN